MKGLDFGLAKAIEGERDAGDVRLEIEDISKAPESTAREHQTRRRLAGSVRTAVTAISIAAAFGLGVWAYFRIDGQEDAVVRAAVLSPEGAHFDTRTADRLLALLPDGRKLAFRGIENGQTRLWVRQ